MRLESINTARMPGMGDCEPPDFSDDLEPTRDEMIIMEADAILAECETIHGAQQFADAWADGDCHVSASLVALVHLAATTRDDAQMIRLLRSHLRLEAMRQADERVPQC